MVAKKPKPTLRLFSYALIDAVSDMLMGDRRANEYNYSTIDDDRMSNSIFI